MSIENQSQFIIYQTEAGKTKIEVQLQTDIYATSVDYDPTLETSITFFKTVQNKLHWATSC